MQDKVSNAPGMTAQLQGSLPLCQCNAYTLCRHSKLCRADQDYVNHPCMHCSIFSRSRFVRFWIKCCSNPIRNSSSVEVMQAVKVVEGYLGD